MNALDLFCGCGGMSKGLEDAGINVLFGIDSNKSAIDNYNKNFNHLGVCADLSQLSPYDFNATYNIKNAQIDIIVGGPPCQGFSIAGKRDVMDPRNSLFMEFVRYLDYFNPKCFIIENVMGILSMKNSSNEPVIDIILRQLEKNYVCVVNKLYASDFEVPQNRRRVIIIGVRNDLNIKLEELKPLYSKDKRPIVGSILQEANKIEDNKLFLSERAINGINNKKIKSKNNGNGFGAQFLDMNKPSYTIPARYWKDGYDALIKYDDNTIRRLSILELKRIQTFPDNYILDGSKKDVIMQIGNAVPCRFAYHIGKHIINMFDI